MIEAMRRLHPRGPDSRGVAVDADGAMLGPDCVLVRRTPTGFRTVAPGEAAAVQAAILEPDTEPGWLFDQAGRIADALANGEIALAQIYGLRIPVAELDDAALRRVAEASTLFRANFNPAQPRVPAGNPDGGQWTDAGGAGETPGESGSNGGGDNEGWPVDAGNEEGWPESDATPAIGDPPHIPGERPETPRERNSIVRRTAHWLGRAAALGAALAPEPRVRAVMRAVEAASWLVEYAPEIRSYLDRPKTLSELQDAALTPREGYHRHHIVERHHGSTHSMRNSLPFGERLESRENIVSIPRWKHVELSTWYSTRNDIYDGLSPRDYLRGKSWDEQYTLGIKKLRDFGVLK